MHKVVSSSTSHPHFHREFRSPSFFRLVSTLLFMTNLVSAGRSPDYYEPKTSDFDKIFGDHGDITGQSLNRRGGWN